MPQATQKKIRPLRHSFKTANLRACETPYYIQLLSEKEITEFKDAFPNMVDFIGPDGEVYLPASPDVRSRSIYAYHDKDTAEKYIMQMLYKFKMRGMNFDQIAQLFNVSVRTIVRWNKDLKNHFTVSSKKIEIQHLIGETLQYYDEIGQTALREMDEATNPMHKARLMETTMRSKDSALNLLEKSGFFLNHKFTTGKDEDETVKQLEMITGGMAKIFAYERDQELKTKTPRDDMSLDELKAKYIEIAAG